MLILHLSRRLENLAGRVKTIFIRPLLHLETAGSVRRRKKGNCDGSGGQGSGAVSPPAGAPTVRSSAGLRMRRDTTSSLLQVNSSVSISETGL